MRPKSARCASNKMLHTSMLQSKHKQNIDKQLKIRQSINMKVNPMRLRKGLERPLPVEFETTHYSVAIETGHLGKGNNRGFQDLWVSDGRHTRDGTEWNPRNIGMAV